MGTDANAFFKQQNATQKKINWNWALCIMGNRWRAEECGFYLLGEKVESMGPTLNGSYNAL